MDDPNEMAMLRFSLIAPAVNGTLAEPSKAAYYEAVSLKDVPLPGGGTARFRPGTLAYWEWRYRHLGFGGLAQGVRSDGGCTRALTGAQQLALDGLRDEFPKLAAAGLRDKMIERGLMGEDGASVSTFQRYVRNNPRTRADATGGDAKDRRAFEAEDPNGIWQGDTMFGPYVPESEGGPRVRAYLQMCIDDRTRVIVAGKFWANDNAANFQATLRLGLEVWGIPRCLYVDNGSPYKNSQITGICGRLGIVLRHTPVRDGAAKGKVERNFRTVRSRFLAALEDDPGRTMEGLNDLLQEYITKHNHAPHSALGGRAPAEVWDELTLDCPPRMPESAAWLDECFLNRVRRRVGRDATVRVDNVRYDVPQHLTGQVVELLYAPGDGRVWVVGEDGRRREVAPTDVHANARLPREGRRYSVDYGWGEE